MCCGRGNASPARVPAAQHYVSVGDAMVPTIAWEWRSVNGVDKERFASEPEARAHIAAGNPGTLTAVPT